MLIWALFFVFNNQLVEVLNDFRVLGTLFLGDRQLVVS